MEKNKFFSIIKLLIINTLVVLILMEVTLRVFPRVIPPTILNEFGKELRSELAQGRFSTKKDVIPLLRDDGGPPLFVWKPYATIFNSHKDKGTVNSVTMDEIGFPNVDGKYSRNESFNLISIGDSFTWCTALGIKDTYTYKLAMLLPMNTYNLSQPGTGIYKQLQIFKKFGIQKTPGILLLAIYEGNDFRDALYHAQYLITNKQVGNDSKDIAILNRSLKGRMYDYAINNPISNHSYSISLIIASIKTGYYKLTAINKKQENFLYTITVNNDHIKMNLENSDLDQISHAKQLADVPSALDVFKKGLANYTTLAKQYNFIPLVVFIPAANTAYSHKIEYSDKSLKGLLLEFSNTQRQFFSEQAKEFNYIFFDLTPSIHEYHRNVKDQELMYFPFNVHLTRFGHSFVAESIAKFLQEKELITKQPLTNTAQK